MQRLVSLKLASKLRNSSPSSHSYKILLINPLTKATGIQIHRRNHLLNSTFFTHPFHLHSHSWHSKQTFPEKILRFFSNPIIVKKFWSDSSNTLFRRSLPTDFRLRFRLPKHISRFSTGFNPLRLRRGSWSQRLSTNDVVWGLIIANAAVFMLWRIADDRFMSDNFTISLENVKSGRIHTVITSAFSHIDTSHLISNMIGLYFFGMNIGRVFGPEFLVKLYLAGAVGGSVFYLVHHAFLASSSQDRRLWGSDPSYAKALGASGAVNAIMLLDIFLFPKSTLYLEFFIPVPAILLGIFLVGKDVLRIIEKDSQISGSAHLGGAAVAALAWAGIRRGRRFF